jgi:hypothetical protein
MIHNVLNPLDRMDFKVISIHKRVLVYLDLDNTNVKHTNLSIQIK